MALSRLSKARRDTLPPAAPTRFLPSAAPCQICPPLSLIIEGKLDDPYHPIRRGTMARSPLCDE